MHQPQSLEEYLDIIEQAQFEVEDLLRCAEEEGDGLQEFGARIPIYQQLAAALDRLHAEVADGSHEFGNGQDLAMMPLVREWKTYIPFHGLIETINTVHRSGF
ncbi:MAG: hypothetical protein M0Z84_01855 [Gammaproteobacteria bacterium]|nr:hypothetical protein [Gammaproteobacteria bacterium]